MLLCAQLEVGGEDTAVLNAVTNVLGNLPAALSPAVGIYLRRVTGSWVPFFGGASTLLLPRWLETNGMASGGCSVFYAFVTRDRIEALVEMLMLREHREQLINRNSLTPSDLGGGCRAQGSLRSTWCSGLRLVGGRA